MLSSVCEAMNLRPNIFSRSSKLKFICDKMLHELAKSLCRCGVDAVYLNGQANIEQCIRIAYEENRIILTQGNVHLKVGRSGRLRTVFELLLCCSTLTWAKAIAS